ncbi:MAG TPA: hypothetical protein VFM18_13810 [Methanosarcina sp.]|nr:hypothetical protein [Methanosarcina sp.]
MTKQINLKILKTMTEENCHGDAYLYAASNLGLYDLASAFASINRQHELLGYLDTNLSEKRYALYQQLMQKAKAKMTEDDFKKFYNCF